MNRDVIKLYYIPIFFIFYIKNMENKLEQLSLQELLTLNDAIQNYQKKMMSDNDIANGLYYNQLTILKNKVYNRIKEKLDEYI